MVRCNNCMARFEENKIVYDGADDIEYCPECGESGCLMDCEEVFISGIDEIAENLHSIMVKIKPDDELIRELREYGAKYSHFKENEITHEELFLFFDSESRIGISYSIDPCLDLITLEAQKDYKLVSKIIIAALNTNFESGDKISDTEAPPKELINYISEEASNVESSFHIAFEADSELYNEAREHIKKYNKFGKAKFEIKKEYFSIEFRDDSQYQIVYVYDDDKDWFEIDAVKDFPLAVRILTAALKSTYRPLN